MPVNKGNSRIDKGIRLSGSWQELDLIVSCLFVTGTFLGTKPMSRTVQTLPSARVEKRDPNTSQKMAFLAVEIVHEPSHNNYLPKKVSKLPSGHYTSLKCPHRGILKPYLYHHPVGCDRCGRRSETLVGHPFFHYFVPTTAYGMIATLFYTVNLMLLYYLYYAYITLIFMHLAGWSLPIFHFKWKVKFFFTYLYLFFTQVTKTDPSYRAGQSLLEQSVFCNPSLYCICWESMSYFKARSRPPSFVTIDGRRPVWKLCKVSDIFTKSENGTIQFNYILLSQI